MVVVVGGGDGGSVGGDWCGQYRCVGRKRAFTPGRHVGMLIF